MSLVLGRAKPAPADGDADGVLDEQDRCPLEEGQAPDGRPSRDRDNDQLLDAQDQRPDAPGVTPGGDVDEARISARGAGGGRASAARP